MDNPALDKRSYRFNIYLGTFFIAFSTLALEITISRFLSAITWYHLAFFAVSTAMLGMTAGATTVYLRPNWFTEDKLNLNLAKTCLSYSISIPVSLLFLCLIQISVGFSTMKFFALLIITFACALPFYFSGIVVTSVLTKYNLPIGKLYASDLIGASLGCLFVLGGLEYIDAPSLIILCGAIAILSVFSFAYKSKQSHLRKLSVLILILLLIGASINSFTINGIRPVLVKGKTEDPSKILFEKWNSFSRVVVFDAIQANPNWKTSPATPSDSMRSVYWMIIDGDAGTVLLKNKKPEDLSILRYDITNIAYYLREGSESACIIGVGGGKDIQSAWLFGIKNITGVDVNPIFVDLQRNKFRDESNIANLPNVNLVVDEARSYLSRSDRKYSIIQMALADTWAATGAGAFSLTENSLYTVEAWKIILDHLDQYGVFTISRWYNPNNLGETGRMVSLAVSSLLRSGVQEPSKHIAMMCSGSMATLIISKSPFEENDIIILKNVSQNLKFDPIIIPGVRPLNNILHSIVSVKSSDELINVVKDQPLNYTPPTDNNPYFFNMLRLSHLEEANTLEHGVLRGNLIASMTLMVLIFSLLILTVITIIFPLIYGSKIKRENINNRKIFWNGAVYFSLIGAGFMLIEIGLIQRLSVFLGHPVYALGILLFTIILSAGTGSFFSEYLPVTSPFWKLFLPCLAAILIISIKFILDAVTSYMISSPELNKIFASILVIFPLGFILGFFFPNGYEISKIRFARSNPLVLGIERDFRCIVFGTCCLLFDIFRYLNKFLPGIDMLPVNYFFNRKSF